MNRKPSKQYSMQIVLLAVTIVVLLAVLVLGGVLIWNVLSGDRDSQPSGTTDPAVTAEPPQGETSAPDTAEPPVSDNTTDGDTSQPATDGTTEPIPTPDPVPEVTFQSDLSEYESAMNPQSDLRDAYLILVNAQNKIGADYVPQNLTNVADPRYDPPAQMVDVAATALKAMFIEMRANGITNVTVTSGYRSYQSQSWYFNHYTENEMAKNTSLTREQAEAIVVTYSNRPGTSEHQTGLCCDMHNLPSADQSFGNTEAGKWLAQNCWKFGFVVRYPAGKTDATLGVTYEPWHFRYVGRYHAYQIYSAGLCLEEYLETLPSAS